MLVKTIYHLKTKCLYKVHYCVLLIYVCSYCFCNDIMKKSHEQRLIIKDHIRTYYLCLKLALCFIAL